MSLAARSVSLFYCHQSLLYVDRTFFFFFYEFSYLMEFPLCQILHDKKKTGKGEAQINEVRHNKTEAKSASNIIQPLRKATLITPSL